MASLDALLDAPASLAQLLACLYSAPPAVQHTCHTALTQQLHELYTQYCDTARHKGVQPDPEVLLQRAREALNSNAGAVLRQYEVDRDAFGEELVALCGGLVEDVTGSRRQWENLFVRRVRPRSSPEAVSGHGRAAGAAAADAEMVDAQGVGDAGGAQQPHLTDTADGTAIGVAQQQMPPPVAPIAQQQQSPAVAGPSTSIVFGTALRDQLAHAAALPEPLRWALTVLAGIASELAGGRVQQQPVDGVDDVRAAVEALCELCVTEQQHGTYLALAACQSFADAWLRQRHARGVTCLSPECSAPPWQLSLSSTVAHYRHTHVLPQQGLNVGLTAQQLRAKRLPLYTLSASLLGRFYELGRCARFLHLRADRGRQSAAAEQLERDGAAACVEQLSFGFALLEKGLKWEEDLNARVLNPISGTCAQRCPQALRGASDAGGGIVPGVEQLVFVDLVNLAYASCNCHCRHPPAGLGRKTEAGRERMHGQECPFNKQLMALSMDRLCDASFPPPGCYGILYQAKFEVPETLYEELYLRTCDAEVAATPQDVVRFAKFQPDYLAILRDSHGQRSVVVIDAKASGKVKQSHQVQVAFYSYMLRRMMRLEEQKRATDGPGTAAERSTRASAIGTVAKYGAVWRPPEQVGGESWPETFGVAELEVDLLVLLRHLFATCLTETKHGEAQRGRTRGLLCTGQEWRLQATCAGCDYEPTCRGEAENAPERHLRRVPELLAILDDWGMSPRGDATRTSGDARDAMATDSNRLQRTFCVQQVLPPGPTPVHYEATELQHKLSSVSPMSREGRVLTGALRLTHAMNGLSIENKPPRGWTSLSPYLEALVKKRVLVCPDAISVTLPRPPPQAGGEWAIFVSLATDPATGDIYAWAVHDVCLPPEDGCATEARQRDGQSTLHACCAHKSEYTTSNDDGHRAHLPAQLLRCLYDTYTRCAGCRVCMYVLEPGERSALLALLADAATASGNDTTLRSWAWAVLFYLLDGRLMDMPVPDAVPSLNDPAARELLLLEADAPRLCVLQTEANRLLALPVPGFASLSHSACLLAQRGAMKMHRVGDDVDEETDLPVEAASAATSFLLGDSSAVTGAIDSAALAAAVGDVCSEAVYRDWSADLVLGDARVQELMARRTRLALLVLTGLRRELVLAARSLRDAGCVDGGCAHFCPCFAPTCCATAQLPFAQHQLSSLGAATCLFKWMEQRLSALNAREERAMPLAVRMAKGRAKAVCFTVLACSPGNNKLKLSARTSVPAELQPAALACLTDEYANFLVAPNSRRGMLDALRFPDTVLCESVFSKGEALWRELVSEAGKELARSLSVGSVDSVAKVRSASNAERAGYADIEFTVTIQIAACKGGTQLTALCASHVAAGCQLVLFERFKDINSRRVVGAARHTLPRRTPEQHQQHDAAIEQGTEMLLGPPHSDALYVGSFIHFCDAPPPNCPRFPGALLHDWHITCKPSSFAPQGDITTPPRAWATVAVTNARGIGASEPVFVILPRSHVLDQHSLYTTLLHPPPPGRQHWAIPLAQGGSFLLPSGVTVDDVAQLHAQCCTPTGSQVASFRGVLQHRLSTVWGPPGTGKTQWAVDSVFTLLKVHDVAGQPLRVLITAHSWEAVHVLLRRLRSKLAAEESKNGGGGGATSSCWASKVAIFDLKADKDALSHPAELWRAPLCVIASTVWQAAKKLGARDAATGRLRGQQRSQRGSGSGEFLVLPKVDMLLVDEASQMPTSDAMLVLELVDPVRGRIVAMGDHLQLDPIIQGSYDNKGGGGGTMVATMVATTVATRCTTVGDTSPLTSAERERKMMRPWMSLLDTLRSSLDTDETRAHRDACVLLDNHRMCATLAAFCQAPAGLYSATYACCDTFTPPCPCRHRCTDNEPLRRSGGPESGGRLDLNLNIIPPPPPWVTSALDPAAKLCVVRVAPGECEIAMLVALLTTAHAAWPGPSSEFHAHCLVIAPHHHQIAALKSKLNGGRLPDPDKLVIDTVERMQGQQADLVFLAYGHVDPQPGEAGFLFSQPRLNVAVTRARFKCIVLVSDAVDMPDEWAAGAAMAEKGVQDGVAYLRRLVRVCRQGSAAAAAGVAVEEPAFGARYIDPTDCVRQGDVDSQRTVDEAAEGAAAAAQQQQQAQGAVRTVCPAPTRKLSRRG